MKNVKKKEIPVVSIDDLGISADSLTKAIAISELATPPSKAEGKILEVEPEEAAKELASYLKNEIKAI